MHGGRPSTLGLELSGGEASEHRENHELALQLHRVFAWT